MDVEQGENTGKGHKSFIFNVSSGSFPSNQPATEEVGFLSELSEAHRSLDYLQMHLYLWGKAG